MIPTSSSQDIKAKDSEDIVDEETRSEDQEDKRGDWWSSSNCLDLVQGTRDEEQELI